MAMTQREQDEIIRANESGKRPVVFIHGLWLLGSSWAEWRNLFEERGFTTLAPSWPDDPDSVEEARRHPEAFAHKSIKQVTDHMAEVIAGLMRAPALIGHSIGGLVTQILAGQGLSAVSVAIDPAPFRGVLPLPLSALRAASPVLANPANYNRAVRLTYPQFRYAFANATSEPEAEALYQKHAVAAPALPLFQAAIANLNPFTEAKVDSLSPRRGPLLIISGQKDHVVPWSMANGAYRRQRRNRAVTEIREVPGRGHSLVIDSGWREVAELALDFIGRHYAETSRAVGSA